MSKKISSSAVGVFIIAALALAAGSVILFGKLQYGKQRTECIAYFEDSVSGLQPGSAVTFRGVKIGQVKRIMIHHNQPEEDQHMPVLIEIEDEAMANKSDVHFPLADPAWLANQVRRGLRAELASESLLTGLLSIELSYIQDAPPPIFHQTEKLYPELPTQPTFFSKAKRNFGDLLAKVETTVDQLHQTIEEAEIGKVSQGAQHAFASLITLLENRDIPIVLARVSATVTNLNQTLEEFRNLANSAAPRVNATLDTANATAGKLGRLAEKLDQEISSLAIEVRQTLVNVSSVVTNQLPATLEQVQDVLTPNSVLMVRVERALANLAEAADSLSALADFLRRNPRALITGRKTPAKP